jgi:hypothetical protein
MKFWTTVVFGLAKSAFAVSVVATLWSVPSHAAAVRYDFTVTTTVGFPYGINGSFTYDSPTVITSPLRLLSTPGGGLSSDCAWAPNNSPDGVWDCLYADFVPHDTSDPYFPSWIGISPNDRIIFAGQDQLIADQGAVAAFIYDFDGTAFTPGVYDSLDCYSCNAQLAVTVLPEPTIWTMVLIGFGSLGAIMRGRRWRLRSAT